jgi:group I intron endonuclease
MNNFPKISGIYKITSPSDKVYIGQSININNRIKHYYYSMGKKQPKLYNSFLKYGFDAHKFEIIEECLVEQLNEREIYWKQHYLDLVFGNKQFVLFCELRDVGFSGPQSDEIKMKKSISMKRGWISRERKAITEETRSKMSLAHKGVPNPKLGITKLNVPHTKIRKPIIQCDLEGNHIKEWSCARVAIAELKCKTISNALRGIAKTANGCLWKYKI